MDDKQTYTREELEALEYTIDEDGDVVSDDPSGVVTVMDEHSELES